MLPAVLWMVSNMVTVASGDRVAGAASATAAGEVIAVSPVSICVIELMLSLRHVVVPRPLAERRAGHGHGTGAAERMPLGERVRHDADAELARPHAGRR